MTGTYNKDKMLKLIHLDRYLLTTYLDMMERNTDESLVLKTLFKLNVIEDGERWKTYKEMK